MAHRPEPDTTEPISEQAQSFKELGVPENQAQQQAAARQGGPGLPPDLRGALLYDSVAEARRLIQGLGAAELAELWAAPLPPPNMLPLHCAAAQGSVETVCLLLDAVCPVEHAEPTLLQTALFMGVWACEPEVVELLLSRGANPLHICRLGLNALEYCRDQQAKQDDGPADVTPEERGAKLARCAELLRAACAAAPPELHRVRKVEAACGHYGGLKKCSGCDLAWYCSRECCKLAWSLHKKRCTVAAQMRRWLALLADVQQPAGERLQQWCQAGGPEALLRRLAKEGAPVFSRAVLEAGCTLPVMRLLCALDGQQRGALDRDCFGCAAGILASLIEAEREQAGQLSAGAAAELLNEEHFFARVLNDAVGGPVGSLQSSR
ncbi:hypothetical protein ABPG75_000306 [Micractinium tetrahymenae]